MGKYECDRRSCMNGIVTDLSWIDRHKVIRLEPYTQDQLMWLIDLHDNEEVTPNTIQCNQQVGDRLLLTW